MSFLGAVEGQRAGSGDGFGPGDAVLITRSPDKVSLT
jgi:hypothetical protein